MVSRKVSSVVSLEAVRRGRRIQSPPPPSGTPKPGKPRTPSPGPNLVRSQNIYLFQVRWPKHLDPARRAAPIRISLGACPHKEARRQADLLIGYARQLFGQMGQNGVNDERPKKDGFSEYIDDELEAKLTDPSRRGELIGELRVYQKIISSPPSPDSPADQKMFAAMRGFVQLSKELSDPENANPVVIDNFESLREKYAADLDTALDEKSQAPRTPSPHEEIVRKAQMLADGLRLVPGSTPTANPVQVTTNPLPAETSARPSSPEAPAVPSSRLQSPVTEKVTIELRPGAEQVAPTRIPVHQRDRRTVARQPSDKPLFSFVAETYLSSWLERNPEAAKDVASARSRKNVFLELIGDHPVDTYTGADLQAFIEFLKFYPSNPNLRPSGKSAREIISANQTLELTPLSKTSIQTVYVSNVKSMIRHGMVDYEYADPFDGVRLRYPHSVPGQVDTEPLSSDDPPPLKWSAVMFRKTEDQNGYETSQARSNCLEVAAG